MPITKGIFYEEQGETKNKISTNAAQTQSGNTLNHLCSLVSTKTDSVGRLNSLLSDSSVASEFKIHSKDC